MRYGCLALATLCALAPIPMVAQNSVFGVHGIGFPGRPISARVRALGGGPAVFDARSAVNPATVSGLNSLVVTASSGTSLRSYTALDSVVDGLSETRFPFALVGTRVTGTPISFAISYSGYAERSYDLVTFDSVTVRNESLALRDRIRSTGAVADIRGALAWRVLPGLNVGGGVHLLSGSLQLSSERTFYSNPVYFPLRESERVALSGFGFSAGVLVTASQALSIGASIRSDTQLRSKVDSTVIRRVDLPVSYAAGVFLAPHRAIRWSTTVERHLWSAADADLETDGTNAFDTWTVGSGVELGGGSGAPLRVGGRYAQLPFSPNDERANELALTAGTALGFAGGRASLEFSVERVMRDGAGAKERAWYLMFALTVMP